MRMMYIGCLLASALVSVAVAKPTFAQASTTVKATRAPLAGKGLTKALENYLIASMRNDQFSGTVLLAKDGKPLYVRAFGMANLELNVPNREGTVFSLASVTKQFTALAVMQLQEEGKVKVDDLICDQLSDCPPAWKAITIHQLLTHTSGIANYSSLPDWDETLSRKDYNPGELMSLFRNLPLRFAPGEKYQYSNSGYHLLGLVIERASGVSWSAYMQQRIFDPLGMKNTGYSRSRALIPNRASGYYSVGTSFINSPIMSPTATTADGGLYSTVGDMLLWDQALVPGRLLSKASLDAIFTPAKNGYGYGWQIGEMFGRQQTNHSGSGSGFSTYIIRFPAERLTAIVLSNSDRASAGKVGNAMAAIALGEPYTVPTPQLRELLWNRIEKSGVASAIVLYGELKQAQAKFDFGDETMVGLGYDLYEARRFADAKAIFNFNLTLLPKSAYSYDGLADIAFAEGDAPRAIALFEKSLELDPANKYAIDALKRLRKPVAQ